MKSTLSRLFASPAILIGTSVAVSLFCAFAVQAATSMEENWPQWRGPFANGVAPAANPPTSWSETSNIKWKVKLPGSGSATPIVWGDKAFVETAVPTGKKPEASAKADSENTAPGQGGRQGGMGGEKPDEIFQFMVVCLDRETGKTLWQKVAREEVPHEGVRPREGSFAASSPMTDGRHVYGYFGSRGLYCYDMDGKLEWQKDFGKLHIKMGFGEGSSAALSGNTIIVNWDNEGGSFIVALDKNTGKELWRESRDEQTTWATPLVVQHDGKAQVITDGSKKIRSYDLDSGKVLWECSGLTANVIPSPVADDNTVYAMSGFRGNALVAIRLGHAGDLTGTDAIAWHREKGTPYVPSPMLYGSRLYYFSNNNGMISCVDTKTGNVLIDAERLEDLKNVYASPVGASGRVYLVGRNGVTVVIKDSDKLEVLATNKLDESFDASPAIAGRELFLRGHEYMYCIAGK
ncbi:MAG TPA: PQQ-binding-like beta-propeller repeat protein [Verrucomicrobiae bacterium]|nr:PQQ-binding-like beta-propeller repeat protein [Verrucomicrobiae bacterium]